ncbi:MAG: class I SAM-dependent methyltransferase [Candidatus Lokiarchaeota archaeon]
MISPKEDKQEEINLYDIGGMLEVPIGHFGGRIATQHLLKLLELDNSSKSRILEVGCGTGSTTCMIAERYAVEIVGMDRSKYTIETARKKAKTKGLKNIKFIQGDVYDIPFEENYFDIIIAEAVNAILIDRTKAFQEYKRVLKPRGMIGDLDAYLVEGAPEEISTEITDLMRIVLQEEVQIYKLSTWKSFFENNGLKIEEIRKYRENLLNFTSFKTLHKEMGTIKAIRIFLEIFWLIIKSKPFRNFIKKMRSVIKHAFAKTGKKYDHIGYFVLVAKIQYNE